MLIKKIWEHTEAEQKIRNCEYKLLILKNENLNVDLNNQESRKQYLLNHVQFNEAHLEYFRRICIYFC